MASSTTLSEQTAARAATARQVVSRLEADGVSVVMLTFVDNGGVTRARAVPLSQFERAATWGVGLSAAWHAVTATDVVTSSPHVGNPAGDIRLVADPTAVRQLAAQPGWAWAPVDQFTQDGEPHPCCSRSYLRRMADAVAESGLSTIMSFELEWFLAVDDGPPCPAHDGPAVGAAALIQLSDFLRDLVADLQKEDVDVEAINAEYSNGQLELAFAPQNPLAAADTNVLTRLTIHGVSHRHGYRSSFSPAFDGPMGNGGHVHLSVWQNGTNLFADGHGRHGLTPQGESFLAGVLHELPGMTAVGAPIPASYLRMQPSRWAGVFQCWGKENREAALRFISGTAGIRSTAANAEVKCFDEASNPYLLLGAVIAAGAAGLQRRLQLPQEYTGDPAADDPEELARLGIRRLPTTLREAIREMRDSSVLRATMGPALHESFLAVREADADAFQASDEDAIIRAYRWRF